MLSVAAVLCALPGDRGNSALVPGHGSGHEARNAEMPTTACAPPMGKVTRALGVVDQSMPPAPFFLHEEGVFNMSDVLTCLHESFNVTQGVDGFDRLPPDIDMHLTDMWLIERMRSHPLRVHDPDKAQLHVIGAPLSSAWRTITTVQTFLFSNRCGTWETHKERTNAIADKLQNMKAFQATKGRNFLLLNSYYFTADTLGSELLSLLTAGPAIFTVADHFFKQSLPGGPLAKINPIVLPYKASGLAEEMAFEEPRKGAPPRPVQFMFHGDIKRKCKPAQAAEGCKRDLILRLDEALHRTPALATSIHTFSFDEMLAKYAYGSAYDPSPFLKVTNFTHTKQSRSRFCLIPSGDTPTSRRLYDALASGCIPVVMAEFDTYAINLPFQRTIDWRRLLFFAGSLPCLKNHVNATADYLRSIAKLDVSSVRKAGREAFRRSLSYTRGEGLVDALLREVTARLDPTPAQHHPNTALQHVAEARPLDAVQPNLAALQHVMDTRNGANDGFKCDQCEGSKWLFVMATRRAGSKTLLEALNSLPNVHLSDDNEVSPSRCLPLPAPAPAPPRRAAPATASCATVTVRPPAAQAALHTAQEVLDSARRRQLANEPVDLEGVMCELQRWFVSELSGDAPPSKQPTFGFKLLIDPKAELWRSKKLFSFLQSVFPCAQYLFNLRTDVEAQAFAQAYQDDKVQAEELQAVNDDAVARTESLGSSRSRLLYLHDFRNTSSAETWNSVAHWLGHPDCSFLAPPEVDLRDWAEATDKPAAARVSCGQPTLSSAVALSGGKSESGGGKPSGGKPSESGAKGGKTAAAAGFEFMQKAPRVYMMPLSDKWSKEMRSCPAVNQRWHRATFPFGKEKSNGRHHNENDLEMWFHDAMKHYAHLTSNPLEADLIYVPAYGRRADVCSRTAEQRAALHKELAEHILNYNVWYPNSTLFMPYGAVCSCKDAPCSPLHGESSTLFRKLHIMAYEMGAPNDNGPPNIVVPQLAFTATNERARVVKQLNARWSGKPEQAKGDYRRTLVLNTAAVELHPNACLHCGACSASDAVSASGKKNQCTPGCANIRERLRMHIVNNYGNDTLVKNIAAEAGATVDSPAGEGSLVAGQLAAMADATFCLQPGGQTLTRAAFYQSIVYGCIPVVFREDFHFTHTLAFSETIPYKELWVHIPETSVLAGEDFVKTLKAVPQATIAAKRKLMRKYAPVLDWNCGLKEGCDTSSAGFQATLVASLNSARYVGLQYMRQMERESHAAQLMRTTDPAHAAEEKKGEQTEGYERREAAAVQAATELANAARAMQMRINGEEAIVAKGATEANKAKGGEGKCTGPLGERVECTDFQWPPEEPESLRRWPQDEMEAELKKAAREIEELKKEAKAAEAKSKQLAEEADAAKELVKAAVASKPPANEAPAKKCEDWRGNPVWCDGSASGSVIGTAAASPSPLPKATEKKAAAKTCKDYAGNPIGCDGSAIASPLPKANEKKCKDYAGNPIWCDGSAIASPSPLPTSATRAARKHGEQGQKEKEEEEGQKDMRCTNTLGEPIWCDGLAPEEVEAIKKKIAEKARAWPSPSPSPSPSRKRCTNDAGEPSWCTAHGAMPSPSPDSAEARALQHHDVVDEGPPSDEEVLQRALATAREEKEEEKRLKWEEDAKKCWDENGKKQWCSLLPKHAAEARQMVKYARMQRMAREARQKAAKAAAAKAATAAKAAAAKALASKKRAMASAAKAKAAAEAKAKVAEAKASAAAAAAKVAEAKEAKEAKEAAASKHAAEAKTAAWTAAADASAAAMDEKAKMHAEEVQFREDAAAKAAADLAEAARAMEARILEEEQNIAKGATGWASDPEGGSPAPWGGRELSAEGAARIVDPGFEPELKVEQVPALESELNLEDAAIVQKMRIKAGTAKLHAEASEPAKQTLQAHKGGKGHGHRHVKAGAKLHAERQEAGKPPPSSHMEAAKFAYEEKEAARRRLQQALDGGVLDDVKIAIGHAAAASGMAVLDEARALRDRLEAKLRKGEAVPVGTTAPKMTAAVTPPPSALALEKKAPPLGKSMASKKCTNEAGEPVYCSTVTPSPSPSPAAVAPAMMCTNEAGEPAYCNSLAEREAADAKRAEGAKAQEERAAKHEQEVKAREAAEKVRSERATAEAAAASGRAAKHEQEVKAREAAEKVRSERAAAEAGAKIAAAEAQKDSVAAAKDALTAKAEAEHAAKVKAHEKDLKTRAEAKARAEKDLKAREEAAARAKALKAEAAEHAERVKKHEEDVLARQAAEKARKARELQERAAARAEEEAVAKERSDAHKAEVAADAKARAENKQKKLLEEKESHEISRLKESEYNLRVKAAKVYKEEGARRARAEKQARANRGHWFYEEKKARAEAESAAQKLKGKAREKAKVAEHRRRETTKDEERKREKAEAATEAEARRRAQAAEAEADARAERAKAAVDAAIAARERRRAAEAKARAEAKALEPSPSPAPKPTFETAEEEAAWEEKRRAHEEEVAAREAAAKVVAERAEAEHEEKVKAHEAEVAAREAAARKVAASTRPRASLQLLDERPRVSHRQALALLGHLKTNR